MMLGEVVSSIYSKTLIPRQVCTRHANARGFAPTTRYIQADMFKSMASPVEGFDAPSKPSDRASVLYRMAMFIGSCDKA
ncbi:uncharacterized protein UV8b_02409 [Ustilaginoidea virens]|uniref:Uncharacterized protein n=1 Tax=Ustilaginoidea virens TaxID=1159556 RepID=A0A063BTA0_USTVR|nr:uncharacterized protein UV8b_02409 [Ustilaginoidea virens]QUC18168.1 hypothetical protein UV8b_02409 [Ustilaginoidea virens]GAO15117.1 hypothetical protein UVI_02048260 [Ustilaginoidea virens]